VEDTVWKREIAPENTLLNDFKKSGIKLKAATLQNFGTFETLLKSKAEKVIEELSALNPSKCLTKIRI